MSNDQDDPLCLVFIPALVALLYKAEQTKGAPLTEDQVIAIRDHANCVALPYSMAISGEKTRGYPDIVAENCWAEWQSARKQLFCLE
ncbi:hypothetical protein IHE49_05365 [Rhodanobacter sp. 7MK24]|uniref:hypothetical protein n=1 Tax=Rhodanobacter sp. 7MK24 TaxID=2775922 RepID=UPI0017802BAD|nr:hypothetical protein [Rhodanobacter sp. 7MK24]MBD8879902.1 hypothetical protein [Rhodanobacter sp. 7MK24]